MLSRSLLLVQAERLGSPAVGPAVLPGPREREGYAPIKSTVLATTSIQFLLSSCSKSALLPRSETPSLETSTIFRTIIETFTGSASTSTSSSISSSSSQVINATLAIASSTSVLLSASSTQNPEAPYIPMSSSETEDSSLIEHRNLIIVLSSILGSTGLLLIGIVLFLLYRYRQGQAPFRHRGVSPINDDEIESWRGTVFERKQKIYSRPPKASNPPTRDVGSIGLASSPDWTWASIPTSVLPPPPTATIPAKAPNARAGLTDSSIPGAKPFIAPPKRQSSRLSKAPPRHLRTKSRRSSTSARSVRSINAGDFGDLKTTEDPPQSMPTWNSPEDKMVECQIFGGTECNSSPGTSIFDGHNGGGLSPRPTAKTRPWESMTHTNEEIGRAIS